MWHVHKFSVDFTDSNLSTSAAPSSPPRAPTTDVLTQPVPCDLVPLNLLSSDWQLSSQTLESTFAQVPKAFVQLLLVLLLGHGYFSHNTACRCRRDGKRNRLGGEQAYVAILIVVNIHLYAATNGRRGWVQNVERAPATIPANPSVQLRPLSELGQPTRNYSGCICWQLE